MALDAEVWPGAWTDALECPRDRVARGGVDLEVAKSGGERIQTVLEPPCHPATRLICSLVHLLHTTYVYGVYSLSAYANTFSRLHLTHASRSIPIDLSPSQSTL